MCTVGARDDVHARSLRGKGGGIDLVVLREVD